VQLVINPRSIWEEVMEWGVATLKGKTLKLILYQLAFGLFNLSHLEAYI
jgi:hypothetical protein